MNIYLAQPIDKAQENPEFYTSKIDNALKARMARRISCESILLYHPERAFSVYHKSGYLGKIARGIRNINMAVLERSDVLLIVIPISGMSGSWGVPQEVYYFQEHCGQKPILIWDYLENLKGKGPSMNLAAGPGPIFISKSLRDIMTQLDKIGFDHNYESYVKGA